MEEDIKILETVVNCRKFDGIYTTNEVIFEAIENLINRNKELEKENKECTFLEDGTEECLWMCSNCKDEWIFYDGTPEDNRLRYCPFCGAKVIKYKSYIEQEKELAEELLEE